VRGRNGKPVAWQLLDYSDEAHGISAMMRTTGYSLAITGLMQVDGRIAVRACTLPTSGAVRRIRGRAREAGVEIREIE